jgi:hypothetical protein
VLRPGAVKSFLPILSSVGPKEETKAAKKRIAPTPTNQQPKAALSKSFHFSIHYTVIIITLSTSEH